MAAPIDYRRRIAVVTGAGSGIGRALSVALAGRGADLALSDVDFEGLQETARMCGSASRVEVYRLDVADRAAVVAHADEVAQAFGAVHLVVNNAGVAVAGTIEDTTFDDFDWLLGINLLGVINATKAFLPHLISSGDGHVVNVSSVLGLVAAGYLGAYSTAKFAVRGFTEALRQEMRMAGHPVQVHCVHPGGVRTNIGRNARVAGARVAGARVATGTGPGDDGGVAAQFDRIARTSPERAAATILAGVDAGRARILVGPDAWFIAGAARLLGARYVDLLGRMGRARSAR